MRNRFILFVALIVSGLCSHAQSLWPKELIVTYRTMEKDSGLLNKIVVTSDTLFYEWMDKKKPVKRKFLMNDTLADKLQTAMKKNKVLKFKSAKPTKDSQNVFFTYSHNAKPKHIIFKQPIKPGSKQEKFMKEFLEPILLLVFQQELKNYPK